MAIQVNVISENQAFTTENADYCTVALPITACWGPGFTLPTENLNNTADAATALEDALENTAWSLFQAGPQGLESFIATYRGPSSNYRMTKDYSYHMALSLLSAGYAVQTCRLCPGTKASVTLAPTYTQTITGDGEETTFELAHKCASVVSVVDKNGVAVTDYEISTTDKKHITFTSAPAATDEITVTYVAELTTTDTAGLTITAKYPGTFGNNLMVTIAKKMLGTFTYWNLIGYAKDANGTIKAIENLVYVLDPNTATDTIVGIDELQSAFFDFNVTGTFDNVEVSTATALANGSDVAATSATAVAAMEDAIALATARFGTANTTYVTTLNSLKNSVSATQAEAIKFNEWIYRYSAGAVVDGFDVSTGSVYDLLKDKINYNPKRVISPWDDQDILALDPTVTITDMPISPMHHKLMDVATNSRCATSYIDVPRSLPRNLVWNDTEGHKGYAQKLSSVTQVVSDPLYASSSALFAPWGQYTYVGTTRQALATPSFMALLIDRAMIKNQATQYEWALPTTRSNNVKLGKLAYTVPKALLDNWQAPEGTRVNTITTVPSLGTTIWGNATLFDVPPATYQALMNLSTRKLINAVKDVVFRIGIGLEFQYNGQEAYAKFFAGVTPLLDTMRNVGAIEDYKVEMAADINGLDSINANSVVGTIYLVIAGVIENITVDLIALPQGTDLSQY